MWVYFNKKGQILETVEENPARAGTDKFEIFAFFEGMNEDNFNTHYKNATIKLRKPDYDGSEYPLLLMNKVSREFELPTSQKFENGETYNGFLFDFGDFNTSQDSEILLDTPGLWEAIVTVIGESKIYDVQGLITFNVEKGISSTDGHEMSLDTVLNRIYGILNDYIPYTGASSNVDLGNKNFAALDITSTRNIQIDNSYGNVAAQLDFDGNVQIQLGNNYYGQGQTGDLLIPGNVQGTVATQEWVGNQGYVSKEFVNISVFFEDFDIRDATSIPLLVNESKKQALDEIFEDFFENDTVIHATLETPIYHSTDFMKVKGTLSGIETDGGYVVGFGGTRDFGFDELAFKVTFIKQGDLFACLLYMVNSDAEDLFQAMAEDSTKSIDLRFRIEN